MSLISVTCELPKLMNNGICDIQNNHEGCNFDGEDCLLKCKLPHLNNGLNPECNFQNNYPTCDFDFGDCVYENSGCGKAIWIGDGVCQNTNRNQECNFDGGDCIGILEPTKCGSGIGDGFCDDYNNLEICHFDGGDCYLQSKGCNHYYSGWVGDGTCNDQEGSFSFKCDWDRGDCKG